MKNLNLYLFQPETEEEKEKEANDEEAAGDDSSEGEEEEVEENLSEEEEEEEEETRVSLFSVSLLFLSCVLFSDCFQVQQLYKQEGEIQDNFCDLSNNNKILSKNAL